MSLIHGRGCVRYVLHLPVTTCIYHSIFSFVHAAHNTAHDRMSSYMTMTARRLTRRSSTRRSFGSMRSTSVTTPSRSRPCSSDLQTNSVVTDTELTLVRSKIQIFS